MDGVLLRRAFPLFCRQLTVGLFVPNPDYQETPNLVAEHVHACNPRLVRRVRVRGYVPVMYVIPAYDATCASYADQHVHIMYAYAHETIALTMHIHVIYIISDH